MKYDYLKLFEDCIVSIGNETFYGIHNNEIYIPIQFMYSDKNKFVLKERAFTNNFDDFFIYSDIADNSKNKLNFAKL